MLRGSLFGLALSVWAVQPGDIVGDVVGLAVAPKPSAAPRSVLRGSPALVIGVQKEWTRLLAADGSSGWTSRKFGAAAPARIPHGSVELADRSPDHASISEGIEVVRVPGKGALITSASEKSRVASPDQLMLPPGINPFLMPWLEIRSGEKQGWIHPSELRLEWDDRGDSTLGPKGIVRRPFLNAAKPVPQVRAVLHFETILSKPVEASVRELPVKDMQGMVNLSSEQIDLLSVDGGVAFSFASSGKAVVTEDKPIVVRTLQADLDGDAKPEVVMELASVYGDGYKTALWIINGAAGQKGPDVSTEALGGASGEPGGRSVDVSWWNDDAAVWIVRVDSGRIEYYRVLYRSRGRGLPRETGYAVIVARFPSRDAAEQRTISDSQGARPLYAFPLRVPNGPITWAVGRLFRERSLATAWRKSASIPAAALQPIQLSIRTN